VKSISNDVGSIHLFTTARQPQMEFSVKWRVGWGAPAGRPVGGAQPRVVDVVDYLFDAHDHHHNHNHGHPYIIATAPPAVNAVPPLLTRSTRPRMSRGHRPSTTPMDFEWSNQSGPIDPSSPFFAAGQQSAKKRRLPMFAATAACPELTCVRVAI
jgi:hypothetical protein